MIVLQNIADLKDPDDEQGRTYREVNMSTKHRYEIGRLVEFDDGVRLFITRHVRDCDGTPLYWFGCDDDTVRRNYSEDGFKAV